MFMCALVMPLGRTFGVQMRPVDVGSAGPMIVSASVSAILAIALWWYGRPATGKTLGRREGALAVALIWLGTGICGGLPYLLDTGMAPADAFFESVSGFTTTGSTVVAQIEDPEEGLSRPILLWRSLTQWLGGMGIVVLFVAVFPNIGWAENTFIEMRLVQPALALDLELQRLPCFYGVYMGYSPLYSYFFGYRASVYLNRYVMHLQVWLLEAFRLEMPLSGHLIVSVLNSRSRLSC